ncbi:MAG: exodeoxyribonuclease VII large subunit [Candidatus Zixiibacteriota bacterium]|nr:MAG: exodeoxyribonuclease VII large subunit [candidate division Zixibacteria bacterium]
MPDKIYSISELTREIKVILEDTFLKVWVEGEISNYTHHSSGHRYFTLKDQNAQIRCVMWKWQGKYLFFEPQDGIKVKASGQITVYEKSGQYQLVVSSMQPAGIGELELSFQQLKKKLSEEGLFDPEQKKPIPEFPGTIGIITSPTGAAIRDILNITRRRAPWVKIMLWPVLVQGEGAAAQISHAIRRFNQLDLVDLLIVGRGGGSLEDLWAFNEEEVARAIFDSRIPVISAVGHEIDFSISDFVADLRAPTPSAAAEIAVPDGEGLLLRLVDYARDLYALSRSVIDDSSNRLTEVTARYGFRKPMEMIVQRAQRCDELTNLINIHSSHKMERLRRESQALFEKLEVVSPKAVMKRGFSYCRDKEGRAVKSFKQVAINDKIDIILYEGGMESRVTRIVPGIPGAGGRKKRDV